MPTVGDTRIFGSLPADAFEAWVAFRYVLVMKLRDRTPDGIAGRVVAQANRVGAAARGCRQPLSCIAWTAEVLQAGNRLERGVDECTLARRDRQGLREKPEGKACKYAKFLEKHNFFQLYLIQNSFS